MRWVVFLLLLAGCSSRPDFVTAVCIGPGEYAITSQAFHAKFPAYAMDHANGWTNGIYLHATGEIFVVAVDPYRLTQDEAYTLLHEEAHRIEAREGWEAARPIWARIHREAPWHMTHREILDRLEAEGWTDL